MQKQPRETSTREVAKGLAYVFVRRDGALLPTGPAGHVGWGFFFPSVGEGLGAYYFGATENPASVAVILPGKDNGWWGETAATETAMLGVMRSRHYDGYKVATVRGCDPAAAKLAADATRGRGYTALRNNCLDHTHAVLEAYGVKGLPWKMNHPSPNDWFVFFIGEYRNL